MKKPYLIAEIGINHNGDMKIWFTNDQNRYPIKIELKINYGNLVLLLNTIN